ncbi:kinase-like domain-containing protein [Rhizophagus irregularis DAOM 181602=DAOM 197198]|nr:kinase-like domain-containing protein [Rhizophagus irregularis DAOM 181602=DAOM 197198]
MFNNNIEIRTNDVTISNTYNLSHEELTQIIQNFDKIYIKEIKPTTQNINESIYEEDLSIVVDELINITFKDLNDGSENNLRKYHILNFLNNHNIILQEIYNWLLNNQYHSNSTYLLGYFNYHGIVTSKDRQEAFKLYQTAAELENIVAQLELANMYIYGKGTKKNFDKAFELSKKLAEKNNPNAINRLAYCYDFGIGIEINKQKAKMCYLIS